MFNHLVRAVMAALSVVAMMSLFTGCGGGGSPAASAQSGDPISVPAPSAAPPTPAPTPSPAPVVTGASYYVAPNGSDSNPGTLALPWKSLQTAVNGISPGSTIFARAGVYSEQVQVSRSGSAAGGYITLQNYPNETPVIDGMAIPAARSNDGLITLTDVSYVKIIGFEVRNFTSNTAAAVPAGIFVSGAGSHIELRNNYVHAIQTTVNDASGNALGIAVYGTRAPASINALVIDGNELSMLRTGSSESLVLNGNVAQFSVTNNRVHDNNNIGIDLIGFEGKSPDPAFDRARDGVVSGNLVYNITSFGNPAYGNGRSAGGIYVDGGTRIVIERNQIHHADLGVELASEHGARSTTMITVRSNLIYLNNVTGISLGGASGGNGGADSCEIYNNTLFHNDTQQTFSGEIQFQYNLANNQIANNLIVAGTAGLFVSAPLAQVAAAVTLDDNLYFSSLGTMQGNWIWNGITYASLVGFSGATGNDRRSRFADPQLVNSGIADFHVRSTSPAVDSGRSLTMAQSGTLDFGGNARVQGSTIDIGAYEQ